MDNQLHTESSSYLLQHKDNPVHWQPWNQNTLQMAQNKNLPLFISIGYSSCHWCHVMAHESFEDTETADYVNANFIPIKIDKEEYPDIDKYYQSFLQATRQQGGWPLSIFALPDGSPFYGGTYFPIEPKHSLPSFKTLLEKIADIYTNDRKRLEDAVNGFGEFHTAFKSLQYGRNDIIKIDKDNILTQYKQNLDINNGGLNGQTKFPNIPVLLFLLEHYADDSETMSFLELTANQLCFSGINDHIRGGFYRYTVDSEWDVPHFEKMLYDNALNSLFLIRMFDKTDNIQYLSTSRKALDFMVHEMSTEYGMAAALDADSLDDQQHLEEGYFYKIFNEDLTGLSEEETEQLAKYAVFNDNVLKFKDITPDQYKQLQPIFDKISNQQSTTKEQPFKDTKVIGSWNMLACAALLEFAELANDDFYYQQALELFQKVRTFLLAEGKVFRINYNETVLRHRTLEDSAYFLMVLAKFHELTREKQFLSIAKQVVDDVYDTYYNNGIFHMDMDQKVTDTFDEAVLSPYGIFIKSMLYFKDFIDISMPNEMMDFVADRLLKYPTAHPTLLMAILR